MIKSLIEEAAIPLYVITVKLDAGAWVRNITQILVYFGETFLCEPRVIAHKLLQLGSTVDTTQKLVAIKLPNLTLLHLIQRKPRYIMTILRILL